MLRDTLKTLLAAYGPSGNEHAVAETVKGLIAAHVDSMRVDALGNLIVEKYGKDEGGKRIMFSAEVLGVGGRRSRGVHPCRGRHQHRYLCGPSCGV